MQFTEWRSDPKMKRIIKKRKWGCHFYENFFFFLKPQCSDSNRGLIRAWFLDLLNEEDIGPCHHRHSPSAFLELKYRPWLTAITHMHRYTVHQEGNRCLLTLSRRWADAVCFVFKGFLLDWILSTRHSSVLVEENMHSEIQDRIEWWYSGSSYSPFLSLSFFYRALCLCEALKMNFWAGFTSSVN